MPKHANVHSYIHPCEETRYAIGHWVESAGQWQCPLDAETARLTGCHTEFAGSLRDMGDLRDVEEAKRVAVKLYGYAVVAE